MADTCIAAQLYTLRDFLKTPEEIAQTFKKVAGLGYRAVQLSSIGPIDPAELRKILIGDKEKFIRNFCTRLLGYALGRGLEPCDQPTLLRIGARPHPAFRDLVHCLAGHAATRG